MLLAHPARATVYDMIQTGQTGAQTQIDTAHTTSISFVAASAWTLGGGSFVMKEGPSTTATTSLSVYSIANGFSTLISQITLTSAQFGTLHGGNAQNFSATLYTLSNPVTFTTGMSYFIALTSSAPDSQSQAYFIKGLSGVTLVDPVNNTAPPTQSFTYSDSTPVPAAYVPEPGTLPLLTGGLLGVAAVRSRRNRPAFGKGDTRNA